MARPWTGTDPVNLIECVSLHRVRLSAPPERPQDTSPRGMTLSSVQFLARVVRGGIRAGSATLKAANRVGRGSAEGPPAVVHQADDLRPAEQRGRPTPGVPEPPYLDNAVLSVHAAARNSRSSRLCSLATTLTCAVSWSIRRKS